MKNILLTCFYFLLFVISTNAQILVNPYSDYTTFPQSSPEYPGIAYNPPTVPNKLYKTFRTAIQGGQYYSGEYEILLYEFFWHTRSPYSALAKTFTYEVVSLPFTMPCAFEPFSCATCTTNNRYLYMPVSNLGPDQNWDTFLYRKVDGEFDAAGRSRMIPQSPCTTPEIHFALVSEFFYKNSFDGSNAFCNRRFLPHSIIKCTINLHCSNNPQDGIIISSFSFYCDNTRGRMRYYPFKADNCLYGDQSDHDVIFMPKVLTNPLPSSNMLYDNNQNNSSYTDGTGTINAYKVSEINNQGCTSSASNVPTSSTDVFFDESTNSFGFPYPSPETLIATPLKEAYGSTLAGYNSVSTETEVLSHNDGLPHTYFVDRDFDLTQINPDERTIYNPSEVNVIPNITTTLPTNLIFPSYHTFKTINGALPNATQVSNDNIAANGGPYSDLRQVPVRTDVRTENTAFPHDASVADDSRYASLYYIKDNATITVQPCVNIFDCAFVLEETGSTLFFENEDYLHNPDRFAIVHNKGTLHKKALSEYHLQNHNINQDQTIIFESKSLIDAGFNVDATKPTGDYIVESGSGLEVISEDVVRLTDGFRAKEGSFFKALATIYVDVPDCPPQRLMNPNQSLYLNNSNVSNENYLTVSPNPSTSNAYLNFYLSKDENIEIKIFDLFGKNVLTPINFSTYNKGFHSNLIDISLLPSGIYCCELLGNTFRKNAKLVVNH